MRVLPFWRVPDAMARITAVMEESEGEVAMTALLPAIAADAVGRERRCRAAVASTLVASLELCRGGTLELTQPAAGGPSASHGTREAALSSQSDDRPVVTPGPAGFAGSPAHTDPRTSRRARSAAGR